MILINSNLEIFYCVWFIPYFSNSINKDITEISLKAVKIRFATDPALTVKGARKPIYSNPHMILSLQFLKTKDEFNTLNKLSSPPETFKQSCQNSPSAPNSSGKLIPASLAREVLRTPEDQSALLR